MYNGIVEANHKERERFWGHWLRFAKHLRVDPYLQTTAPAARIAALGAFAAAVREGQYSAGTRVRVQTVQVALRAIGTTCELDGLPNPCYQHNSPSYCTPLRRLLNAFRQEDPAPKAKLAVPVAILGTLHKWAARYDT